MAKKQQWKKAIRAEVAAALQGQPSQVAPSTPVTGAKPTQKTTPTSSVALDTTSLSEVRFVLLVAAVLLVVLVLATWTNQKSRWLDNLAVSVSRSLSTDATQQAPAPTGDATTPAPTPTA